MSFILSRLLLAASKESKLALSALLLLLLLSLEVEASEVKLWRLADAAAALRARFLGGEDAEDMGECGHGHMDGRRLRLGRDVQVPRGFNATRARRERHKRGCDDTQSTALGLRKLHSTCVKLALDSSTVIRPADDCCTTKRVLKRRRRVLVIDALDGVRQPLEIHARRT